MADLKNVLFLMTRHGETILNEADKFRGWSNGPDARLTDLGIKQARQAGKFIERLPVEVSCIVSSDLDRAQHSAAIIAGILGIDKIYVDKRLRPLNVGSLAGKVKAETPIDEYIKNPTKSFPDGESIQDFDRRQAEFADRLMELIQMFPGKVPLVQCHVSNIMYQENLHKPSDEYLDEKSDLVGPGGVVAATAETVIPLLKENKHIEEHHEK